MGKTYMNPIKPMSIEKIPFPKEEIECLVEQIIKLNKQMNDGFYSHHIDETISILNEGIRLLAKPYLILDSNGK